MLIQSKRINQCYLLFLILSAAVLAVNVHAGTESLLTLPADYRDQYNQMKSIESMKGEAVKLGGFDSARSVILNNLTEQQKERAIKYYLLVSINHRHLVLSGDDVLVEDSADNGVLRAYPQPMGSGSHKPYPYRWCIDSNGSVLPMEWSRDPGLKEDVNNAELTQLVYDMLKILKDSGLHQCFGITAGRRDSLPPVSGHVYWENSDTHTSKTKLVPRELITEKTVSAAEPLFFNQMDDGDSCPCSVCEGIGEDGECAYENITDH